jgi:hypothetical protein
MLCCIMLFVQLSMETIKPTIQKVLKNISEALLTDVVNKLEECGCESLEDCRLITESD